MERRQYTRRDERLAILEERYASLNEKVMVLEEVLSKIGGSVDNMASEIAKNGEEFKRLREEVSATNKELRKDLAPLTEIQNEARAAFRFLRRFGLWVVLPSALLYVAVSGIPAAENAITILVKILINGMAR